MGPSNRQRKGHPKMVKWLIYLQIIYQCCAQTSRQSNDDPNTILKPFLLMQKKTSVLPSKSNQLIKITLELTDVAQAFTDLNDYLKHCKDQIQKDKEALTKEEDDNGNHLTFTMGEKTIYAKLLPDEHDEETWKLGCAHIGMKTLNPTTGSQVQDIIEAAKEYNNKNLQKENITSFLVGWKTNEKWNSSNPVNDDYLITLDGIPVMHDYEDDALEIGLKKLPYWDITKNRLEFSATQTPKQALCSRQGTDRELNSVAWENSLGQLETFLTRGRDMLNEAKAHIFAPLLELDEGNELSGNALTLPPMFQPDRLILVEKSTNLYAFANTNSEADFAIYYHFYMNLVNAAHRSMSSMTQVYSLDEFSPMMMAVYDAYESGLKATLTGSTEDKSEAAKFIMKQFTKPSAYVYDNTNKRLMITYKFQSVQPSEFLSIYDMNPIPLLFNDNIVTIKIKNDDMIVVNEDHTFCAITHQSDIAHCLESEEPTCNIGIISRKSKCCKNLMANDHMVAFKTCGIKYTHNQVKIYRYKEDKALIATAKGIRYTYICGSSENHEEISMTSIISSSCAIEYKGTRWDLGYGMSSVRTITPQPLDLKFPTFFTKLIDEALDIKAIDEEEPNENNQINEDDDDPLGFEEIGDMSVWELLILSIGFTMFTFFTMCSQYCCHKWKRRRKRKSSIEEGVPMHRRRPNAPPPFGMY